jgi:hypothetical protein
VLRYVKKTEYLCVLFVGDGINMSVDVSVDTMQRYKGIRDKAGQINSTRACKKIKLSLCLTNFSLKRRFTLNGMHGFTYQKIQTFVIYSFVFKNPVALMYLLVCMYVYIYIYIYVCVCVCV